MRYPILQHIARYLCDIPGKQARKINCDTIAASIARYERYHCGASWPVKKVCSQSMLQDDHPHRAFFLQGRKAWRTLRIFFVFSSVSGAGKGSPRGPKTENNLSRLKFSLRNTGRSLSKKTASVGVGAPFPSSNYPPPPLKKLLTQKKS